MNAVRTAEPPARAPERGGHAAAPRHPEASVIGGAIGLFGGEEVANQFYDVGIGADAGLEIMADRPRLIKTSTLTFGTAEARRSLSEMQAIENDGRHSGRISDRDAL